MITIIILIILSLVIGLFNIILLKIKAKNNQVTFIGMANDKGIFYKENKNRANIKVAKPLINQEYLLLKMLRNGLLLKFKKLFLFI